MSALTPGNRWLLRGGLAEVDPDAEVVIRSEGDRQRDKLILIPSESLTPLAVREALGSAFTSIYAEGYPSRRMDRLLTARLADVEEQLAYHRRLSDRRFYKGTEFANMVEALAKRRVAELFATDGQSEAEIKVSADEIFANVQALSGAAANNAVYEALLQPGDTIMGLELNHGGHLTHGSPVNRSGKYFRVVSYGISPQTGRFDYDEMARMAVEHRPRIIVAGATAYPWDIDWKRLREIADLVPGRAYLLADISHPAGLVVAGLFPNPIGYADVVTFTTHKTMLGPRAAAILSTDRDLADRIDRAVFPGEQGGPHVHQIAAMAVAFHLAKSQEFCEVQRGIVDNAKALARSLQERGLRLVGGGTNTHLLLVDLNSVKTQSAVPLKGDVTARILDICGLVCNRNTIPGDVSAGQASGLRLGTVWLTQRGFGTEHMARIADLIHRVVTNVVPFSYVGVMGPLGRGKIDFDVLREVRHGVDELVQWARDQEVAPSAGVAQTSDQDRSFLEITGERAAFFLNDVCANRLLDLGCGERRPTALLDREGRLLARGEVWRLEDDQLGRQRFVLGVEGARATEVRDWLEALSDGYVLFDPEEVEGKVQGPVVVRQRSAADVAVADEGRRPAAAPPMPTLDDLVDQTKPYFIGQKKRPGKRSASAKPEFHPTGYQGEPRRSCLYDEHLKLTASRNLVPFAGWTMPLWYTSIGEEHRAVREDAGLFDVSHMGVLELSGPGAARFLDLVTTNYVLSLQPGQAHYSYVLDPDGLAIDDVFLYRVAGDRFILVVNAANAERVESWLRAVNDRSCLIDRRNPAMEVDAQATIRNLKDAASGDDRRVDLALQGPKSLTVLRRLVDATTAARIARLGKSEFVIGSVAGIEAIVSRTGYTGEDVGYELYVHPDRAPELWRRLLEVGAEDGLRPAGLGARDSTRTEAGFPLYGHELAGQYGISPIGAGYGAFVKLHKPFFIGRSALMAAERGRTHQVVRFAMDSRGIRAIRPGDPVVNQRGQCIGHVTSCTAIEGRQVGLAYIDQRYSEEGTPIAIFPLPRGGRPTPPKAPAELKPGDDIALPESGRVLSRFMVKEARL
ncbi:MAG: glycine cleavage system aminomethyltransferase GcvT [Chloroflexota bacterium]